MNVDTVLLTNEQTAEKLYAHIHGLQHYAFSIFIFNSKGELLLQKRAWHKYHSGGLWTNTCCSHPASINMQMIENEAKQRLLYEIGIDCSLHYIFRFSYKANCENLIENEIDYVFIGYSDDAPLINIDEISTYSWRTISWIEQDRIENKEKYTKWFHFILNNYSNELTRRVRSDLNI